MIRVIASFMTLPRRPCNEEVTLIRVIATFMKLPRRPCNKEVTIIHVIASFMTLPTRPCNKEVTLMQLINKTNVWSEFIHDDDVIYNIKSKLINYSSFIKLAMLCIYNVFIYITIHLTYFLYMYHQLLFMLTYTNFYVIMQILQHFHCCWGKKG